MLPPPQSRARRSDLALLLGSPLGFLARASVPNKPRESNLQLGRSPVRERAGQPASQPASERASGRSGSFLPSFLPTSRRRRSPGPAAAAAAFLEHLAAGAP